MTRRDHGDWGIAVALLVAVVATIAFRIIELRAGDSAEQARVDARHAIALATKVEDAAQRLDTCVTESRCDDPAEFSPGRRTLNEGLVVALTRGVAPAYVPFTEMTHEWNHAVIAAIDEDGVVTDQPAAETLAGGPMIDDLLSELDRVHGELTDDALEHRLFARAGVKQGQRRRQEPEWAELSIELKKPGVTLLILWARPAGFFRFSKGLLRFSSLPSIPRRK